MKQSKFVQIYYTMLHVFYWLAYGFAFMYASLYLQSRGVGNTQIGLVLAFSFACATALQPMIAVWIDRFRISVAKAVVGIYAVSVLLSIALYFVPMSELAVMIVMVAAFSLLYSLQPSIISLSQVLDNLHTPVNFGVARGVGSLAYAIVMSITGQVLQHISPLLLPLGYGSMMVLSIALLLFYRPVLGGKLQAKEKVSKGFPAVRTYPFFWMFLTSAALLAVGEGFFNSFLLQIMQNVGGNSGSVGIAMGVCSGVEFAAMLLFSRVSKRFGVNRLMVVCGFGWVLKAVLMVTAASPAALYAAFCFQFLNYALYTPGSIEFVSRILPEQYYLKGQSLTVSAYTLGNVITTFFGGMLIDTVGVRQSLTIVVVVMLLGSILMAVSAGDSKRNLR